VQRSEHTARTNGGDAGVSTTATVSPFDTGGFTDIWLRVGLVSFWASRGHPISIIDLSDLGKDGNTRYRITIDGMGNAA